MNKAVSFRGRFFFAMIEKISFSLFGFELLEPMAFVSNAVVALVCATGAFRAGKLGMSKWMIFFVAFALASLSGAFSHLFWNYWGFAGKVIPWFFGVVASGFLTVVMIDLFDFRFVTRRLLHFLVVIKGVFVLFMAYTQWNFLFVAVDTILSLFVACGIGTFVLYFKYKRKDLLLMLIGFLVMLPAAFVFLFKLDLHLWLNREDLSHFLIASGLFFFVQGLPQIRNKNAVVELLPLDAISDSSIMLGENSEEIVLK